MSFRNVKAHNTTADGDSSGGFEESSASRAGTIVRAFGRDSSSVEVGMERGGELGKSLDNLSHSLSGASVAKAPSRGK